MKKTRDTFKSIVENKSSVLKQIGQYETELSNLEYFDNIITRTEEEIALPLKAIQTELPESLIVKVREIIDGDTIRAHWDAGGITLDIRLVGVNTPEKGEIGSKESTAWIAKQIYGREVEIKIDPKNRRDIYDRVLGTIFYEGENINLKEIEEGWAFYYRYERNKFMNESEYAAAEEKAKKNKKGIWALVVVTGTVAVSSSPTHAKIFLDDVDTKLQTAETIKNVEVGKHKIKISLEGYQDYVEKVQVLENKKVEVYKKLEKLTPEQAATMIGEPGVEKIKISKEDFFKEIKNFYSGRMYMSKTEFTNLILKYDVSDIQSFIDEVNSYYPGRMYLSKKELIELGTKYGLDVAGL
jgi:micrococcal nuclease